MKERLGTSRALRVRNGLYACRYAKEWYHAPSVDALLDRVAPPKPEPEVAGE